MAKPVSRGGLLLASVAGAIVMAGVILMAVALLYPAAPAGDPYAVYLRENPPGSVILTREDAQARAMLGCDQDWAPGTVDRALADAYRPTGVCDGV